MDLQGDEKWLILMNFFPSLKKSLNSWAKSTGFIKRQRSLSARDFLVLMTIGQLGIKHPSLAATAVHVLLESPAIRSNIFNC
jgi:hypothetical protein